MVGKNKCFVDVSLVLKTKTIGVFFLPLCLVRVICVDYHNKEASLPGAGITSTFLRENAVCSGRCELKSYFY